MDSFLETIGMIAYIILVIGIYSWILEMRDTHVTKKNNDRICTVCILEKGETIEEVLRKHEEELQEENKDSVRKHDVKRKR